MSPDVRAAVIELRDYLRISGAKPRSPIMKDLDTVVAALRNVLPLGAVPSAVPKHA